MCDSLLDCLEQDPLARCVLGHNNNCFNAVLEVFNRFKSHFVVHMNQLTAAIGLSLNVIIDSDFKSYLGEWLNVPTATIVIRTVSTTKCCLKLTAQVKFSILSEGPTLRIVAL